MTSFVDPALKKFARNHEKVSSSRVLDEIEGMFSPTYQPHPAHPAVAGPGVSFGEIDTNADGLLDRDEWDWQQPQQRMWQQMQNENPPVQPPSSREGSLSKRLFQELEANGGSLSGQAVLLLSHSVDALETGIRAQQQTWDTEKSEMQHRMQQLLQEAPTPLLFCSIAHLYAHRPILWTGRGGSTPDSTPP